MKIKKLGITGFGKFKNKDINFTDGINVVYGENESGKTTTHKFIQGMFFGFFKPYSKNKIYTEDYNKFRPWKSDSYQGNLEFVVGKTPYRIERNFDKNNESFKLYDNTTGKDLTEKLPYDKATKQRIISPVIKLNSVLFNNTISIAQMANKTEEVFKKEIVETLANYEKGNNNNISVNKAIDYLNNKKRAIGTKKQSRSKYGSAVLELQALEEKKQQIMETLEKNKDNYLRLRELENELEDVRNKKIGIVNNINNITRNKEQNAFYKYSSLAEENEKLQAELDELQKYKYISNELYEEFLELFLEHKNLSEQLKELMVKEANIKAAYSDIEKVSEENKKATKGKSYNKIVNDIDILEDRLSNIKRLNSRLSDKKDIKVEKDYSSKSVVNKVINILCIIMAVVSVFLLAFSYTITKSLLFYFYIALAVTAVLAVIKIVVLIVFKETRKQYVKYDTSLIRTQNMIELNEVEINKLLEEYGESDPYKLIEELRKTANLAKGDTENDSKSMKYKMDIDELEYSIGKLKEKLGEIKYNMNIILRKNGIDDFKEFKDGLVKREKYSLLLEKIKNNEMLMQSIIEGYDLDELKEKYGSEPIDEAVLQKMAEIGDDSNLEGVNENIAVISAEIAKINGILEDSGSKEDNLCEINEGINKLNKAISKYEWDLEVIDKAIDTINLISEDIHKKAAPSLNKTLGDIMSRITNGAYSTVKIDENMNVMVLDNKNDIMVDAEKLSNGTIDQIYLALRFSIIDNLLLSDKMPVILDDCFVQYDDVRLKEILNYLNDIAKKRQIIIFSCHKREQDILDQLGITYNRIQL